MARNAAIISFSLFLSCLLASSHLAQSGYIFTAPKVIRSHHPALFRLTLTDVAVDGKVSVRLLHYNNDSIVLAEREYDIPQGELEHTLSFDVPEYSGNNAKIEVNGTFGDYVFSGKKEIDFQKSKDHVLIQTDKALYKPGQKVQLRVLPVTSDLTPVTNAVAEIYVTSPSEARIAQWKNVTFQRGIEQFDFTLTEEPEYGLWQIVAEFPSQTIRQHFEVNEYVLPKFEVTVTPPSYLLANAKEVVWKICATYTFGQPVEGTLLVNVSYEKYHWETESFPYVEHQGPINGCFDFVVNTTALRFNENYQVYKRLELFAQVNETGTGITLNKTSHISRTSNPLELKFIAEEHGNNYFKPLMPYYGTLLVKKPDGLPLPGELIQLCLLTQSEIIKTLWWRTDRRLSCKNYTSDDFGLIKFTLPPLQTTVVTVSVEATAVNYEAEKYDTYGTRVNQPKNTLYLQAWYSASNNFVQIQPSKDPLPCTSNYKVQLRYTGEPDKDYLFHYQIVARGQILKDGTIPAKFTSSEAVPAVVDDTYLQEEVRNETLPSNVADDVHNVGSLELELAPDSSYVPLAKLLVFYVRPDGEVIADSQEFEVEKCLRNNVTFKFGSESVQPATSAAIHLTGSPLSFCGVGVVDKSVHLLKQDNQLTKAKVFDLLKRLDINRYTWPRQASYDYCRKKSNGASPRYARRVIWPGPRTANVEYVDSITAFDESGVVVISDLTLETRPCREAIYDRPPYALASPARRPVGLAGPPAPPIAFASPVPRPVAESFDAAQPALSAPPPGAPAKSAVEVRTYFPETWLWELKELDEHGNLDFKEKIPHTVTEWVGSAVCINDKDGIGISDPARIKAFQPFFASFSLPYSVIRGEVIPITLSVFNYLDKCLPVDLTLAESEDFEFLDERSRTLCVCGSKSVHKFLVKPKTIGEVNVTVSAVGSENVEVCGDKPVEKVVARDAVTRQLLVEAEGFKKEETKSVFICSKGAGEENEKPQFELALPEDVVEGSARAYVAVTGDIMGPAIKNLDSLVQVPTGCGEQNMVKFTPNVYVLDYLKATGKQDADIEKKAVENLKTGYQRQQKYRHPDGSYSAFGTSDRQGSLFLTAFVFRSFRQAERYIPVDEKILQQSVNWILDKQLPANGCFNNVGRVLSSGLKGRVNESNPGPLTAYVLAALLEGGLEQSNVTEAALRCIEAQRNPSPHNLALAAYVAALAGQDVTAKLEKLESIAVHDAGLTHWRNGGTSADVETAAYAVLTYVKLGGQENLSKAQPIVRWMATKRNSRGGFSSTQDTVLGLQALSAFSSHLSKDPVDIAVKVSGEQVEEDYDLKEDSKLVLQQKKVVNLPNTLIGETTGTGCALISTTLRYNVHTPPKSQGFELTVAPVVDPTCKNAVIKVCTKFEGEQPSNMAVVELKLVSGYTTTDDDIKEIYQEADVALKRHEIDRNQVNFYFEEVTSQEKCFEVQVHREIEVADAKPATVKVYDYYQLENAKSVSYSLNDCGATQ